jgi:hypothetical protein
MSLFFQSCAPSQARNQNEAGSKEALLGLFFDHDDSGGLFLRITGWLLGVISSEIEIFI